MCLWHSALVRSGGSDLRRVPVEVCLWRAVGVRSSAYCLRLSAGVFSFDRSFRRLSWSVFALVARRAAHPARSTYRQASQRSFEELHFYFLQLVPTVGLEAGLGQCASLASHCCRAVVRGVAAPLCGFARHDVNQGEKVASVAFRALRVGWAIPCRSLEVQFLPDASTSEEVASA